MSISSKSGKNRTSSTRATLLAIGLFWSGTAYAAEQPLFEVWRDTGPYRVYAYGFGTYASGGNGTFQDVAVGGPVAKAYLYWIGANLPAVDTATDSNITFTRQGEPGIGVQADDIYIVPFERPLAPGTYFWNANHSLFIADITDLIDEGTFDYSISDFDMDQEYGVGLQIVYQDRQADPNTEVAILQGHDYAFSGWPNGGELNRTDVAAHTFEPAPVDRVLEVTFFMGGGEATDRPDQLWFLTGTYEDRSQLPTELITNNLGTVLDSNPIEAVDDEEWDTITKKIIIPAGDTFAAFQFQSGGGSGQGTPPESFSWISATFAMRAIPEPGTALLLGAGALAALRRRRQA